jgi:hypothetical protein
MNTLDWQKTISTGVILTPHNLYSNDDRHALCVVAGEQIIEILPHRLYAAFTMAALHGIRVTNEVVVQR